MQAGPGMGGGGGRALPIMDYEEALSERGTLFRQEVYKKVGISRVEVYKRGWEKLPFRY